MITAVQLSAKNDLPRDVVNPLPWPSSWVVIWPEVIADVTKADAHPQTKTAHCIEYQSHALPWEEAATYAWEHYADHGPGLSSAISREPTEGKGCERKPEAIENRCHVADILDIVERELWHGTQRCWDRGVCCCKVLVTLASLVGRRLISLNKVVAFVESVTILSNYFSLTTAELGKELTSQYNKT